MSMGRGIRVRKGNVLIKQSREERNGIARSIKSVSTLRVWLLLLYRGILKSRRKLILKPRIEEEVRLRD